jgi:hypothetical protein
VTSLFTVRNSGFVAPHLVFERAGVWIYMPSQNLAVEAMEVDDKTFHNLIDVVGHNTNRYGGCLSLGGEFCESFVLEGEPAPKSPWEYIMAMRDIVRAGMGFIVLFLPSDSDVMFPSMLLRRVTSQHVASTAMSLGLRPTRADAPLGALLAAMETSPQLTTSFVPDRIGIID